MKKEGNKKIKSNHNLKVLKDNRKIKSNQNLKVLKDNKKIKNKNLKVLKNNKKIKSQILKEDKKIVKNLKVLKNNSLKICSIEDQIDIMVMVKDLQDQIDNKVKDLQDHNNKIKALKMREVNKKMVMFVEC